MCSSPCEMESFILSLDTDQQCITSTTRMEGAISHDSGICFDEYSSQKNPWRTRPKPVSRAKSCDEASFDVPETSTPRRTAGRAHSGIISSPQKASGPLFNRPASPRRSRSADFPITKLPTSGDEFRTKWAKKGKSVRRFQTGQSFSRRSGDLSPTSSWSTRGSDDEGASVPANRRERFAAKVRNPSVNGSTSSSSNDSLYTMNRSTASWSPKTPSTPTTTLPTARKKLAMQGQSVRRLGSNHSLDRSTRTIESAGGQSNKKNQKNKMDHDRKALAMRGQSVRRITSIQSLDRSSASLASLEELDEDEDEPTPQELRQMFAMSRQQGGDSDEENEDPSSRLASEKFEPSQAQTNVSVNSASIHFGDDESSDCGSVLISDDDAIDAETNECILGKEEKKDTSPPNRELLEQLHSSFAKATEIVEQALVDKPTVVQRPKDMMPDSPSSVRFDLGEDDTSQYSAIDHDHELDYCGFFVDSEDTLDSFAKPCYPDDSTEPDEDIYLDDLEEQYQATPSHLSSPKKASPEEPISKICQSWGQEPLTLISIMQNAETAPRRPKPPKRVESVLLEI